MTEDAPRYGGGSWMHGPEAEADSRRKRRRLVALLLIAAASPLALLLIWQVVTACACTPLPPSAPASPPTVSSPTEGIVIAVDAASLTDVRGFTLRTPKGYAFGFKVGPLENATEFPPGHLAEHQATSSPVRVYFRVEGEDRVAYRLEDAAPSPAPTSGEPPASPSLP